MIRTLLLALCVGVALPHVVSAQIPFDVELDAVDYGWYRDNGVHAPNVENYLTGIFGTDIDSDGVIDEYSTRNSFFQFDLNGFTVISDATLRLFQQPPLGVDSAGGYSSPDATETFTLFGFEGDQTNLLSTNGNGDGVAIFNDLGSGTILGSVDLSDADEDSFIDIVLNADGLSFLESAAGGSVVLGAAVTSLNTTDSDEYVFGVPDGSPVVIPSLTITTVPEPSSITLIGLAMAATTIRRKRR